MASGFIYLEKVKKTSSEYYTSLDQQKLSTNTEKFGVIDTSLVIAGWTGNIIAQFKNGDTMLMNNYEVTNGFNNIDGNWKIIHAHKSALPPKIIKRGQ